MVVQPIALLLDAQTPGIAASSRLKLPFQEMQQQNREAGDQLPLFAATQAVDLSAILAISASSSLPARGSAA